MELFRILGTIALDGTAAVEGSLKGVASVAEDASKSFQGFSDQMASAGAQVSKFISGPIIGAGAGMLAFAKKAGDSAKAVINFAQQLGTSTDKAQHWQNMMTLAGGKAEGLGKTMLTLGKTIESGSDTAKQSLEKLGLSIENLGGMDTERQFSAVIDGLMAIPNATERAKAGAELFGDKWLEVSKIVNMSAEEFNRAKEASDHMLTSFDDLKRADDFRTQLETITALFGNASDQLGRAFLPVLEILANLVQERIIPAFENFVVFIENLVTIFESLSPGIQEGIVVLAALTAALGPLLMVVGQLIPVITGMTQAFSAGFGALKTLSAVMVGINPVVGALVVAIGALYAVFGDFEGIVRGFQNALEFWREKTQSAIEAVRGYWENFKTGFENIANSIGEKISSFVDKARDAVNWLSKLTAAGSEAGDMKMPDVSPGDTGGNSSESNTTIIAPTYNNGDSASDQQKRAGLANGRA